MVVTFWDVVGLVLCGVLSTVLIAAVLLGAVALGAYIVYKTKREDGSMFEVRDTGGEVVVARGEYDDDETGLPLGEDVSTRGVNEALDTVMKQTARFMKQQNEGRVK